MCNNAFCTGDTEAKKIARSNLKEGIREAKLNYKMCFCTAFLKAQIPSVCGSAWQCIKSITDYKGNIICLTYTAKLSRAVALTHFFTWFYRNSNYILSKLTPQEAPSCALIINLHEVRWALSQIIPDKDTGSDGVLGQVLENSTGQLTATFTSLFKISLEHAGHCPHLPQVCYNHPCSRTGSGQVPEWPRGLDPHSYEVISHSYNSS